MGVTSSKIHVTLDSPPIDVKVYVYDAGKALDAALVQHGAPPRPLKAVPIHWVRKPRGLADDNAQLKAH